VQTLAIFVAMLALIVVRPRRWNEAWWTALGAAAMLSLRLVSPREALQATVAGSAPVSAARSDAANWTGLARLFRKSPRTADRREGSRGRRHAPRVSRKIV
jgi:hypothetical protein